MVPHTWVWEQYVYLLFKPLAVLNCLTTIFKRLNNGNLSGLKRPKTGNTDKVGMLLTGEPGAEYRTELYMRTKYEC